MQITTGSIVQKTAKQEMTFMAISPVIPMVNASVSIIGRENIVMNRSAQRLAILSMVIAKLLVNAGKQSNISSTSRVLVWYGVSELLVIYYLWSALIPGCGNDRGNLSEIRMRSCQAICTLIHTYTHIHLSQCQVYICPKYPFYTYFIHFLLGVVKAGQEQIATNVLSVKDVSMVLAMSLLNAIAMNFGVAMIAKSISMHVAIHQIRAKMEQFAKINMAILHALVPKDFLVSQN